jgi:hypothetical protein
MISSGVTIDGRSLLIFCTLRVILPLILEPPAGLDGATPILAGGLYLRKRA